MWFGQKSDLKLLIEQKNNLEKISSTHIDAIEYEIKKAANISRIQTFVKIGGCPRYVLVGTNSFISKIPNDSSHIFLESFHEKDSWPRLHQFCFDMGAIFEAKAIFSV
jgi:hypothetical protein